MAFLHVLYLLRLLADHFVEAVLIHLAVGVPGRGIRKALVDHFMIVIQLKDLALRHDHDRRACEQLVDEQRVIIAGGHHDALARPFQLLFSEFQPALDGLGHQCLKRFLLDFRRTDEFLEGIRGHPTRIEAGAADALLQLRHFGLPTDLHALTKEIGAVVAWGRFHDRLDSLARHIPAQDDEYPLERRCLSSPVSSSKFPSHGCRWQRETLSASLVLRALRTPLDLSGSWNSIQPGGLQPIALQHLLGVPPSYSTRCLRQRVCRPRPIRPGSRGTSDPCRRPGSGDSSGRRSRLWR